MKKITVIIMTMFFSFCVFAQNYKNIPDAPNPPKLVNDLAKILSTEQKDFLERKLVAYDDSTSNQIVIVTVGDLHDYSPDEFATAIGNKWGVGGSKKFDNGVVILVSTGGGEGNRAAFIATGEGMEGSIPDVTAVAIVDNELIPNLKSGNYFQGFDRSIDAIIKAAAGEYTAPSGYRAKSKGGGISIGKILGLIIVIIIVLVASGRGGGGGGGYVSRGGSGWLAPFILGSMLGRGGSGFGGGSGGFGGGGGGGGFGGFGGGGFGGGGAGGSW